MFVTRNTKVTKSDKVYEGCAELKAASATMPMTINLDEVKDMVAFQLISCDVKIISVDAPNVVTGYKIF